MKNLVGALLCLSSLLLTNCAEDIDKKKKDQLRHQEVVAPMSSDLVRFEVIPKETANEYIIRFSWPRSTDVIEIKRSGLTKKVAQSFENEFEEVVQSGRTYQYEFKATNFGSTRATWTKKIEVPLDIILTDRIDYFADKEIVANRLFIKKGAEVYCYKNRLKIEVNEIHAEGGKLQNYPVGYQECLPNLTAGQTGGPISIKAKKADGELNITLVGAMVKEFPFCNQSGYGGTLKVSIEDGLGLQLNTNLLEALGPPKREA